MSWRDRTREEQAEWEREAEERCAYFDRLYAKTHPEKEADVEDAAEAEQLGMFEEEGRETVQDNLRRHV